MTGAQRLRIALVAGAVVLAAVIYLLPKTPLPDKEGADEKPEAVTAVTFSMEKFIADAKMKTGWNADNKLSSWEQELEKENGPITLYDSIAKAWDAAQIPGVAGWYYSLKAAKSGTETDWLNAAYRYFDAFKAAKDSSEALYFVDQAVTSYTRVITLNPGNLNAKTDLGILYAEGTSEPMKGITLLREVVTENPNHENAHLNLGFLSMKSGQYEKAIERFKRVLEINPARLDMYIYSGEAYVRLGQKEKAIEQFGIFKNLSNDQSMIKDVDAYIESLKNPR